VASQAHAQKQVTALPPTRAGFPLPGQTNSLPFVHASRDLYLVGFHLVGAAAPQRYRPGGAMQRFLERNHNIGLDIAAAGRTGIGAESAGAAAAESRLSATAAEKLLKEIAKPGAIELELNPSVAPRVTMKTASARTLSRAPIGRRLKSARLVPIRPKPIVFRALFPVAQHFVSLVDLLKFFLGRLLVLGHIGMVLARQLSKRALDFVVRGCLGQTKRFVIISELHRHRHATLCGLRANATLPCIAATRARAGALFALRGRLSILPRWICPGRNG